MACTLGAFLHTGQVCMATERVIVYATIVEDFLTALQKSMNARYGLDVRQQIFVTAPGVNKTRLLFKAALTNGAKLILGDPEESSELDPSSMGMRPIILANMEKGLELHENESFGTSVVIYTFETEEDALAIANDIEYGLSGAVFTEDLATGLRIARGYETGAVHINAMAIHDESNLAHGGTKKSGSGRFTAQAGIEE